MVYILLVYTMFSFPLYAMQQDEVKLLEVSAKQKLSYGKEREHTSNVALKKAAKHSWRIQKTDLCFHDYTDEMGILKLQGKLKGQYSSNPFLFRLCSPDEQMSFLLLGSMHFLPLQVFSNPIQKLLEDAPCLTIEGDATGRFTYPYLTQHNLLTTDTKWLEDMPSRRKNHIEWIIQKGFAEYEVHNVSPSALSPFFAHAFYINTHWEGMDRQLRKYMKEKGREIKTLELFEEASHQYASFFPGNPIENFSKQAEDSLFCGGMLNMPSFYECSYAYLSGEILFMLEYEDPSIIRRNKAWMPKLLKTCNNSLTVVGLTHLFGSEGLLINFSKLGFTIEQADPEGEWEYCS